jgi:transposase-like protein
MKLAECNSASSSRFERCDDILQIGTPTAMRRLSLSNETITVRCPPVRGLEARFEGRLLPLFKRHTEESGRLLPKLYLHGLAQRDFESALRGVLGAGAALSASSVVRLTAKWQAEYDTWKRRRLDDLEPSIPVDGRHLCHGVRAKLFPSELCGRV